MVCASSEVQPSTPLGIDVAPQSGKTSAKKVVCFATHLFVMVLPMFGTVSMPTPSVFGPRLMHKYRISFGWLPSPKPSPSAAVPQQGGSSGSSRIWRGPGGGAASPQGKAKFNVG
jgi:hypothetical protein